MIRHLFFLLLGAASSQAATIAADSARGARLFETLSCVQCHSVNGRGDRVGTDRVGADLGARIDRNFTPAALAATMWNHAPVMWASMREREIRAGDLDDQGAADLFAYFYSARFFEKPGDAGRGRRLFTDRACAQCHGLTDAKQPGIKPVSRWSALADPIALTGAMWNHAPAMFAELKLKKIAWPQLTGQDLSDLLVYLRSAAPRDATAMFETSAGVNGEAVFKSKRCGECHQTSTLLAQRIKGQTLTEVAADMWNHASRLPAPAHFEPDEMRELLSFLWAQPFIEDSGDAARGKRVFAAKRCTACHNERASGAPKLTGGSYSGVTMVSALWRHGPRMLEQMKSQAIAWPRFDGRQMSDLIAYLNSGRETK